MSWLHNNGSHGYDIVFTKVTITVAMVTTSNG